MNGMIVTWDQWSKASARCVADRDHDPLAFLDLFKSKMELEQSLVSTGQVSAHTLMIRDCQNQGSGNYGAFGYRPGNIPFSEFLHRRFGV
ncbi:MAG: hypothetical protein WA830_25705 [Candidatus Sulfotelmatobacter sp.]